MEYQNPLHPKTSYGIADGGGPTVAGEKEGHGNGGDDRETLSATSTLTAIEGPQAAGVDVI